MSSHAVLGRGQMSEGANVRLPAKHVFHRFRSLLPDTRDKNESDNCGHMREKRSNN